MIIQSELEYPSTASLPLTTNVITQMLYQQITTLVTHTNQMINRKF